MLEHVLVVETSTRQASIALVEFDAADPSTSDHGANVQIHSAQLDPEIPHDRDLLPAIRALLDQRQRTPNDLTGLLLGRGPGSFTGLRVGAATTLGLAHALAVPVLGRPSMEAVAFALLRDARCCGVVLDARRGSCFVARYTLEERGALQEVLAPRLVAAADLASAIPHGELIWTDCPELVRAHLPAQRNPFSTDVAITGPQAKDLWHAAAWRWRAEFACPRTAAAHWRAQFLPLYLRASSPEEKRAQELGAAPPTQAG